MITSNDEKNIISKIANRTMKNNPNKITASVVLDFFLLDTGANAGIIIMINPEHIRIKLFSLVNIIKPINPIKIKLTTPLNALLSGSTVSRSLRVSHMASSGF